MRRPDPLFLLLLLAVSTSAGAQMVDLTLPPAWETPRGFTRIVGVALLGSDRTVVVDAGEGAIALVESDGKTVRTVGRRGGGPGEFQRPTGVYPGAAGALYIPDAGLNVVHVLDTSGRLVRYLHPPESMRRRIGQARGVDTLGRIYLEGLAYARGIGIFDSVAILRWDPSNGRSDTLAMSRSGVTGSVDGGSVSLESKPYAWADEWVSTADGGVAIARVNPYRVDRVPARSRSISPGARLDAPRIPVTAAERARYRERMTGTPAPAVGVRGGQGVPAAPGGAERVEIPDSDFPEFLPPFHGRGSVVAAADGRLWIRRLGSAGTKVVTWDIIGLDGRRVGEARLSPDSRVVAVGGKGVFVVREDEQTGLEFLRYHRLP